MDGGAGEVEEGEGEALELLVFVAVACGAVGGAADEAGDACVDAEDVEDFAGHGRQARGEEQDAEIDGGRGETGAELGGPCGKPRLVEVSVEMICHAKGGPHGWGGYRWTGGWPTMVFGKMRVPWAGDGMGRPPGGRLERCLECGVPGVMELERAARMA